MPNNIETHKVEHLQLGITEHSSGGITADSVKLIVTDSPTYSTVQDLQNIFHSSGHVSGGTIIDAGSDVVNVEAGTGYIRASDNALDNLIPFNWSASNGLLVPLDTTRYVGVDYNAGTPEVVIKTTYDWNYQTNFPLGIVINTDGIIHIEHSPHRVGDHASLMIQRVYDVQGIQRDNKTGGIILSETGTRNITVSAGNLWDKLNKYSIPAFDSSGTDTFDAYYSDGVGGFNEVAGLTQWPNTQYNNGGTLTTLTNNWYAVLWFYIELDGDVLMVYGTNQYTTADSALIESSPAIPDRIAKTGILIGKLIFQKSASTAAAIYTAFSTIIGTTGTTDHGNLAGLEDDDHSQYALLLGRSGGQTLIGGTAASNTLTLSSTSNATKGKILFGTSAYDEVNNRLGIGTSSPSYPLDVKGDTSLGNTRIYGADGNIEINTLGSGNRYAYIDFHGDDTYTDYGLRIIRDNSGANSSSQIIHRGTGTFQFTNTDGADWYFNGGDVGIGTTPTNKLDVDAATAGGGLIATFYNSNANDNTDHYIRVGKTTSANQGLAIGHHYDSDGVTSSYSWLLYGGDSIGQGINLKSGGLVGIGTTPSYKLDVLGAFSSGTINYAAKFFSDGNNANYFGILIQAGADAGTGTTNYITALDGDGGQVGYIANASGTFQLVDSSDERLKEDIRPTNLSGLDILNKIVVSDFTRKKSKEKVKAGFIAQQVQQIYPQAVSEDENGYLGVGKDHFIGLLIKSVQELTKQVEKLQKQVKILQEKLNGR